MHFYWNLGMSMKSSVFCDGFVQGTWEQSWRRYVTQLCWYPPNAGNTNQADCGGASEMSVLRRLWKCCLHRPEAWSRPAQPGALHRHRRSRASSTGRAGGLPEECLRGRHSCPRNVFSGLFSKLGGIGMPPYYKKISVFICEVDSNTWKYWFFFLPHQNGF